MKKYNKSEIMKAAWKLVKESHKWVEKYWITLSEALKRAWKEAKEVVRVNEEIEKTHGFATLNIGMSTVVANAGDGVVSGNTYKCKETLKNYGLKFNGTEKYWEGTTDQVMQLIKNYL